LAGRLPSAAGNLRDHDAAGIARGHGDGDFLSEADADEASGRQRVAVADEFHRVGC
jgi:hypothetical protein